MIGVVLQNEAANDGLEVNWRTPATIATTTPTRATRVRLVLVPAPDTPMTHSPHVATNPR